jgi:hypothetical protein
MQITRTSVLSGITRTRDLPITDDQWKAFCGGLHIQRALHNLSDGDREFILSGSTEEEWDEEFAEADKDDAELDAELADEDEAAF